MRELSIYCYSVSQCRSSGIALSNSDSCIVRYEYTIWLPGSAFQLGTELTKPRSGQGVSPHSVVAWSCGFRPCPLGRSQGPSGQLLCLAPPLFRPPSRSALSCPAVSDRQLRRLQLLLVHFHVAGGMPLFELSYLVPPYDFLPPKSVERFLSLFCLFTSHGTTKSFCLCSTCRDIQL